MESIKRGIEDADLVVEDEEVTMVQKAYANSASRSTMTFYGVHPTVGEANEKRIVGKPLRGEIV